MKRCSKCKETKGLDCFHNYKGKPDGKATWCKVCVSTKAKNRDQPCPGENCKNMMSYKSSLCKDCKGLATRGKNSPSWKGGRGLNSDGYIILTGQHGQFNAYKNGKVREHVLVKATEMGRALRPGETVHHKNNIPWDNRPENLELRLSYDHPSGASIEDLVVHWVEMLETYAPERLNNGTR